MSLRILFNPINREITAEPGDILLTRMREEEVRIEALCGGKGQCGKCKVILEKGLVEKISTIPDKFLSEKIRFMAFLFRYKISEVHKLLLKRCQVILVI